MEVYVYVHEDIDTIVFLSERILLEQETYCPTCQKCYRLLGIVTTLDEVNSLLLAEGFSVKNQDSITECFNSLQGGSTYDELYSRESKADAYDW